MTDPPSVRRLAPSTADSPRKPRLRLLYDRLRAGNRGALDSLWSDSAPVDLRFVGRTLSHAALVGLACGLAGALLFFVLEHAESLLLEHVLGYRPLRAAGESFAATHSTTPFRPWLLLVLPALGGLVVGLVSRAVPQVLGGGADGFIHAFHREGGRLPRRLLWAKPLATLATLSSGGAGGREGPSMLIGATIGSLVASVLRLGMRERRLLLVAGVAGSISAIFRTPLGAALLAVEILYRDGFESDALVPSVLSSVVAYSVVIFFYGESTLFAYSARFPVPPAHLPLYVLLAITVSFAAYAFVSLHHAVVRGFLRLPLPAWLRPALGGLLLGAIATPCIVVSSHYVHSTGHGIGLLGGGYGAVQVAISGAAWLPEGWWTVLLFAILAVLKMLTTSVTVGSGGSAGDFAPSLAIGGLVGGAFGRAAQLLLDDPRLDAGAFALVGMGAFYGGLSHVPLAALVLVCELAGNYDLLVPLMIALTVASVALRKQKMYGAQVASPADSPAHQEQLAARLMSTHRVHEVMQPHTDYVTLDVHTTAEQVLRVLSDATWQDAFPVLGAEGALAGSIHRRSLGPLLQSRAELNWLVAADVMEPVVCVGPDDSVSRATALLVKHDLRELLVVDERQQILGFLDENDVARLWLTEPTPSSARSL